MLRGLKAAAAGLVFGGLVVILTGGREELARALLLTGLFYAVAYLALDYFARRRGR